MNKYFIGGVIAASAFSFACAGSNAVNDSAVVNAATAKNTANPAMPPTAKTDNDFVPSETGMEKAKSEAGKANVQGRVLYNGKSVEGVEIKLCETFSRFGTGCGGETFTTKTDASGEYLIANVPAKIYEGLLVRVFNTKNYIFATQGIGISSAKYKIEADKTFFAPETNLFKDDLKVQNPKEKAKVDAANFELKWDAYPDAAYYKFSFYPQEVSVSSPYINERIEGGSTAFKVTKPLPAGEYRMKIEAFNAADVKLADTGKDIIFSVQDGAGTAPANK